jgi:dTDP-4-dehydrorhamnose 3,5-epimerase-like enzyme
MAERVFKAYGVVKDDRGTLFEVSKGEWQQINMLVSRAGSVRGNHYHKTLSELFFVVVGRISVTIENVETGATEAFVVNEGEGFCVKAFEAHSLRFETDTKLISAYDRPFDAGDIFPFAKMQDKSR